MEFYSVLKQRRSVRAFAEKEVEKEKIDQIIGSVILAPSAGNLQSYKVYVVRNPQAKEELAIAADGQEYVQNSAVVLVFCADQKKAAREYRDRGFELFSVQDATIAAAYSQLAAAAEGLGSVWVGSFDPLEVSRIVNAPPYVVPVALIPIGYPADEPTLRERQPIGKLVKELR